jgi:hypothetical protein
MVDDSIQSRKFENVFVKSSGDYLVERNVPLFPFIMRSKVTWGCTSSNLGVYV